jgi:phosphoglycerol transferase MdoB-like AlkP superfamily enzyme
LPAVISSIPSPTEAYILTPYSGNAINSIGSILKKHSYHTSFFHGGHKNSMGFSAFMHIAGFDNSYAKEDYNNDADYDGTWGIYDEDL